jgi:hypothetical protein
MRGFTSGHARLIPVLAALASACVMTAGPARAEGSDLSRALDATKPIVDLRLRLETVEQAGIAPEARALTLRGRIGFETGSLWKTTLLAEGRLLAPLDSDYNSTVNGKTQFPVVADPEVYGLNRLQLTNTALPGTTIVLGRQRLNLDDQRFIGSVGWRQNEQTIEGLRVTNKSIPKLTLDFTFLDRVNRVFGPDSAVGRYRGNSYLGNGAYQTRWGKLSGFAYLVRFDEAPTDSSQTFGLRFAGERRFGGIALTYAASYAYQEEYGNNPLNYDDDYGALEAGVTLLGLNVAAGVDLLAGNGVKGFTTPLATLHAFDGWADKFLTTPANGLEDRYGTLGYTMKSLWVFDSVSAKLTYHKFGSQRLSIDYGTEVDAQLIFKIRRYAAMVKYADYNADSFATDTRKFWVQLEYVR